MKIGFFYLKFETDFKGNVDSIIEWMKSLFESFIKNTLIYKDYSTVWMLRMSTSTNRSKHWA
jgi:hypothetical protein